MGQHDEYGKVLLRELLGERWDDYAPERSVDESGVRADLDGIIWSGSGETKEVQCAVEIEARVYKQIRGAVVDLALHPAPKKLLVVIRAQPQLGGRDKILRHLRYVWEQVTFGRRGEFQLVCLEGTGDTPAEDKDKNILAEALREMMVL